MPRLADKFFEAQRLRKKGFSIKEISVELGVAKSTASSWLRDVPLSEKALRRLSARVTKGQLVSAQNKKKKVKDAQKEYLREGVALVESVKYEKDREKILKIYCALLYYCEGAKSGYYFQFTNSDPELVKVFLSLLRDSFLIDESKFRISLHLHGYHSVRKQIGFWSRITQISNRQFIKPYKKLNSGKRTKADYQGCVNIKYYDTKLAREILGIGKAFIKIYRGVR